MSITVKTHQCLNNSPSRLFLGSDRVRSRDKRSKPIEGREWVNVHTPMKFLKLERKVEVLLTR